MSGYPQNATPRRLVDVAAFLQVPPPAWESAGRIDRPDQSDRPEHLEQPEVVGIAQHSSRVQPGVLYVARPGVHAHGAGFAQLAAAAGAVAALTDPTGRAPCEAAGLPTLVVPDPAAVLGRLSAWIYGSPSAAMTTLGVTGTNGKTTTTMLLDAALTRSGHHTGVIGTIGARVADVELPVGRTTPEAPDLQALFAAMVEQGTTAVSMEVSSHALALGRVAGTDFDVVGFVNLSHDHLEQHGDMERYYLAKASLFTPEFGKVAVINVDDPYGARLAGEAAGRGLQVITVSPSGAVGADWRAGHVEHSASGALGFEVTGPVGIDLRIALGLSGDFNVANALVAAAMLDAVGVDPATTVTAFAGVQVPGRMERVGRTATGAIGMIDYAHTPDAVATVLRSLRRAITTSTGRSAGPPSGRIIAVLGCGGDRDTEKRPEMGEEAARAADVVVLTDDNPRSEDPAAIRAAIRAGTERVAPARRAMVVEPGDRREAIEWAIQHAQPGDIVVVLGKGHETGQEIGGVVHPFDDREVLAEAIAREPMEAGEQDRVDEPAIGSRTEVLSDRPLADCTIADVIAATGGRPAGISEQGAVTTAIVGPVVADSRSAAPGGLFVADGNGHDYAGDAVARGAVAVLASRELPGLPTIVCPPPEAGDQPVSGLSGLPDRDASVLALGRLARAHIARLTAPGGTGLQVVAVTGSSGKTGTKDLLADVLGVAGPTVAPDASLNDELGVPLTALRAGARTAYLVLEMGARGIGHLSYLSSLVRPRIAIVLNVGTAHVGEFGSRAAVAQAKGELVEALPEDGLAILNADDPLVRAMAERSRARVVLVGTAPDADIRATDIEVDGSGRPRFRLSTRLGAADCRLRTVGRHQVGNALAVAAAGLAVGMEVPQVADALSAASPRARWRMQVVERGDGITVVNDAYNANPESMRAAIDATGELAGDRRTWAVLGVMRELGELSHAAHEELGRYAAERGIHRIVAVGAEARPLALGAEAVGSVRVWSVDDRATAMDLLRGHLRPGDVVLVKSSRDSGLRHLGDALIEWRRPPEPPEIPESADPSDPVHPTANTVESNREEYLR